MLIFFFILIQIWSSSFFPFPFFFPVLLFKAHPFTETRMDSSFFNIPPPCLNVLWKNKTGRIKHPPVLLSNRKLKYCKQITGPQGAHCGIYMTAELWNSNVVLFLWNPAMGVARSALPWSWNSCFSFLLQWFTNHSVGRGAQFCHLLTSEQKGHTVFGSFHTSFLITQNNTKSQES